MAASISAISFQTPVHTALHPESAHMRQLQNQGQSVSEIATTLAVPEQEVLAALGLATANAPALPPFADVQASPGTASAPTSLSVKA